MLFSTKFDMSDMHRAASLNLRGERGNVWSRRGLAEVPATEKLLVAAATVDRLVLAGSTSQAADKHRALIRAVDAERTRAHLTTEAERLAGKDLNAAYARADESKKARAERDFWIGVATH